MRRDLWLRGHKFESHQTLLSGYFILYCKILYVQPRVWPELKIFRHFSMKIKTLANSRAFGQNMAKNPYIGVSCIVENGQNWKHNLAIWPPPWSICHISEPRRNGVTDFEVLLSLPLDLACSGLKRVHLTRRTGGPRSWSWPNWMTSTTSSTRRCSSSLLNWRPEKVK